MKNTWIALLALLPALCAAQMRTTTYVDAQHRQWLIADEGKELKGGIAVMVGIRSAGKYSAEINGPQNQQLVLDTLRDELRKSGAAIAAPESAEFEVRAQLDWATLGGPKLYVEMVRRGTARACGRRRSTKRPQCEVGSAVRSPG
jgi:hypothetical protein